MSKIDEFKDNLIYESQKAFYDERGRGARYRMTTAGVAFFRKEIGDCKDLAGVVAWLQKNGYVKSVGMSEDNLSVTLKVKGCCLEKVTDGFRSRGKEPLSCPIANIIMHSMELNGSMPPEITPIEFVDGACKVRMAKIYTSDVVESEAK